YLPLGSSWPLPCWRQTRARRGPSPSPGPALALPRAYRSCSETFASAAPSGLVGGGSRAGGLGSGVGRRRQQGAGYGTADVEILVGDPLDVVGRHLGNGHRPVIDLLDGEPEHQPLAVAPRQRRLAVGFVDKVGDECLFGALQFIGRDRALAQFV